MSLERDWVRVLVLAGAAAGCQGAIGVDGRGTGTATGTGGTPAATGVAGSPGTTGAAGTAGGLVTGAGGVSASTACQGDPQPGRAPLRRLTRTEYANTVRDLLGDKSNAAASFPPEEEVHGFLNNADAYTTSDLHILKYLDGAEKVAAAARTAGKFTLPCKAQDVQKCATDFIRSFGLKALRRPLEDAEVASYAARFQMGLAGGSFEEGLEWVVGRMLQSPYFLYRVEQDPPPSTLGKPYAVPGYALATRLSYFLWETTPDDQLLADAGKGLLATPEGIETEVARMMADAKFADTLASFHDQWLGLPAVVGAPKTAVITPAWNATLQGELLREADLFIKDVYDAGGSFTTLLTGQKAFLNKNLAQFYGVAGPADAATYAPTTLPNRHGVLTLPALLAGLAHADQSAPVKRGKLIREQILCSTIPDPPNNLIITVPKVQPGTTTRQRFEMHRTEASCAACHTLMDPLAMPLEYYDELGRYRTMDGGKPVDGQGQLTATSAADKAVSDPGQLGAKLAALPEAQSCMVSQWFRFSTGHAEEQTDACTVTALRDRFARSGQGLRDLLVGISTSASFRYRVDP